METLKFGLDEQRQLAACEDSQFFVGMNDGEKYLLYAKNIGDGFFEVFANANQNDAFNTQLSTVGYLDHEKKILSFWPKKCIVLEVNSSGKSIIQLGEEMDPQFEFKFTQKLINYIIDLLFDKDGNPDEEELIGLPGGRYLPSMDDQKLSFIMSKLMIDNMHGKTFDSFSQWVIDNLNSRDVSQDLMQAINKINIPIDDMIKYLLGGKPLDQLYGMIHSICTEDFVKGLLTLSKEYVQANACIKNASQHDIDTATTVLKEIQEANYKTVKIFFNSDSLVKKGNVYSIIQNISPAGVYMDPRIRPWDEINEIRIGNHIIYRK